MRIFCTRLFFFCLITSHAVADTLPEPVVAALKRAHIPLSSVSIVVQESKAPAPIINLNAERPVNPASTMKLLTTFAALETLGPAFRWKTEAYLNGKLEDGVLQGDLVFKGFGDPKMTVEQFWMWLREMRQRGLRDIRGDIVLDHSFFEVTNQDPAEFDNDPTRAYNVGTNALLLNFNAIHLHLIPNGHETTALLDPDLAGYTVFNRITTSKKMRCGGSDTYRAHLEGHKIVLEGRIPAYCGELDDYFSLLPHDEYFLAVFSALWQELGGTLKGKLREGTAPADSTPFAMYVSPPLSEVIRDINKFSNNIMARQLFLTLGTADTSKDKTLLFATQTSKRAEVQIPDEGNDNPDVFSIAQAPDAASLLAEQEGGDTSGGEFSAPSAPDIPSSVDDQMSAPAGNLPRVAPPPHDNPPSANITRSTAAMRQWLKTQQLQFPELVLENGAGLSRKERISAQHLAELLLHAARSPFSAELEASLPILGMDGSVKKRLKDSESAGYAHLKTGTLEGVKSLAGYVKAHSGKQWIVVFIVNHSNAALAQPAQDALVEWLQKEL